MSFNKAVIPRILGSIFRNTEEMLEVEAGIAIEGVENINRDAASLELHDVTAVASLGPPVALKMAFSFDHALLNVLFAHATAATDIPDGDRVAYYKDTAAEAVNTILGRCAEDFQSIDKAIDLSTPTVLVDNRSITRPDDAIFGCMRIRTSKGGISVSLIGPLELFDDALNYKEGKMGAKPKEFLIVDDSLIAVGKLTGMLRNLGYGVAGSANTGAKAVEAYREHNPDFVTMDITMPDMDGIEATKRIINEFPGAKIIMVTSHGQEKMVLDALKAGAKGYVLKPVREDRLGDMIDKVMSKAG